MLRPPPGWSIPVLVNVPPALRLLTVVIPARDEEGSIGATLEGLANVLRENEIPFEIVAVDDGSTDRTWTILQQMHARTPELRPVQNAGRHGFGCAVVRGLDEMQGDAVIIMMADQSPTTRTTRFAIGNCSTTATIASSAAASSAEAGSSIIHG